jgi:uncharacterized protein YoxC
MQPFLVAIVILLAVLVGVAIPALIQLRSTLKSAQTVLDQAGPKLQRTLDETAEATARLNRLTAEIEAKAKQAEPIVSAALDIGTRVTRLGGTLQTAIAIGSAIGPALTAGVRAFFTKPNGTDDTTESEQEESR